MGEGELQSHLTPYTKIKSYLSVKVRNIKLLDENNIFVGSNFLDRTEKALTIKETIYKLDFSKFKMSAYQKIVRNEYKATGWEKNICRT